MKEIKGRFLQRFFCPKKNFLRFVFYVNVQSIKYTFRIFINLHIKKTTLHTLLLLVFKIVESLQCILKIEQYNSLTDIYENLLTYNLDCFHKHLHVHLYKYLHRAFITLLSLSILCINALTLTITSTFSFTIYFYKLQLKIQFFLDCNWIGTQNHLVRKRTLNHLAKFDLYAAFDFMFLSCHVCVSE